MTTSLKVYCGFNSADRKNIADYAEYILADYPAITSQKVKVAGTDMEITPFDGWNITTPAKSLTWWSAFDCIKHNRHGNFKVANQENVFNMLAALYLLEMKQFSKVARRGEHHLEEPDNPEEQSKLFSLEDWTFRYVKLSDSFVIRDGELCCVYEV